MPRANRYFLPGYIWHITHRCHKQVFLLKFIKYRENWMRWLIEAKKRYGLCVLDYMVTSNHIHLLVKDQGKEEISRSMQLIAVARRNTTTAQRTGKAPIGKTVIMQQPLMPMNTLPALLLCSWQDQTVVFSSRTPKKIA